MAGLSQEHSEALTELRRRVAAPQAAAGADGDTASLAEKLRATGEVVDDACLRRSVLLWFLLGSCQSMGGDSYAASVPAFRH